MADDFKHDLIIATDDGVFWLKDGVWNDAKHKIPPNEYEYDQGIPEGGGSWQVLRELLQCGASVAVVPPKTGKPQPPGTCYVLNLAGFKRSNPYHVK